MAVALAFVDFIAACKCVSVPCDVHFSGTRSGTDPLSISGSVLDDEDYEERSADYVEGFNHR